MNDELRQLLNDLDKPTKVKKCVECGYITTNKTVPDYCPQCNRKVEK